MSRSYVLFLSVWVALAVGVGLAQTTAPQAIEGSKQAGSAVQKSAPGNSQSAAKADYDPLLDLPPLPTGKVTLVGGTVAGIDQIRNHMKVRAFGGGSMEVAFDERTHIFRDGIETTQLGIHKGDRVYVDTMLDRGNVFAKTVRVVTKPQAADARGQVLSYDPQSGLMTLQDELSLQPVSFRLSSTTVVRGNNSNGSSSEVRPGSLVAVKFSPDQSNRRVAQEISVLAVPGTSFTFYGRITYLNLRTQTIVVENQSDKKIYEISFNPATIPNRDDLHEGKDVLIQAAFNGTGYKAKDIRLMPGASPE